MIDEQWYPGIGDPMSVLKDDMSEQRIDSPWQTLRRIREREPLIHAMANFVAADLTANLLLAVGASAAMAHRGEEVEDFVALADALSINLGTLSNDRIEPMVAAARCAVELGRPWTLDPVAVGSSPERRDVASRLAGLQPTVIRGNAGEILSLGDAEEAAGVDSLIDSAEALDAARDLARSTGATVAVTGAVDYVTDGECILAVANGHPLMVRVTGVGCGLTALIAACCAVEPDAMTAAAHGLTILGLAGEIAASEAVGPASFRVRLIDSLYNLDEATLETGARIQ
jgi:hydroxyethylthiazole kinase